MTRKKVYLCKTKKMGRDLVRAHSVGSTDLDAEQLRNVIEKRGLETSIQIERILQELELLDAEALAYAAKGVHEALAGEACDPLLAPQKPLGRQCAYWRLRNLRKKLLPRQAVEAEEECTGLDPDPSRSAGVGGAEPEEMERIRYLASKFAEEAREEIAARKPEGLGLADCVAVVQEYEKTFKNKLCKAGRCLRFARADEFIAEFLGWLGGLPVMSGEFPDIALSIGGRLRRLSPRNESSSWQTSGVRAAENARVDDCLSAGEREALACMPDVLPMPAGLEQLMNERYAEALRQPGALSERFTSILAQPTAHGYYDI